MPVKPVYCPPGYDPTTEEFPIPGPRFKGCIVILAIGIGALMLGGMLTLARPKPTGAVPTVMSIPTDTPIGTITPAPSATITPTFSPNPAQSRTIPLLPRLSVVTATDLYIYVPPVVTATEIGPVLDYSTPTAQAFKRGWKTIHKFPVSWPTPRPLPTETPAG
jgi:hypothetical protein